MPTEDVGQDDPLQYPTATIGALTHLLTQIDSATSTLSSNLTPESYAALAALPLSYPWSSLVLDLKDLLPILDRYVLCCLLASSAATGEPLQNDQVLTPLLKTLAQTIVNIISPQASLNTRPVLPKEIYKVEFWHAHLNYACHRAYEAALPGGSAARLAGDQLCHWNTLAPNSVFQATHLVVFLPPCLGAFVLSNHSSHSPAFFKYPPPELQTNEGLTACVKQVANYPLPSILVNQEEKLASARKSAADGYLSSYTIPPSSIGFFASPFHLPTSWAPGVSRPPLPTTMDHAPRKPSRARSALPPPLPTILPLSTLLRLPHSYNFLIRSPSLERSGALPLAPFRHIPRTSKIGLTRAPFAFTLMRNTSFLVPLFKPCLPLLKNTSLAKSAWIN